MYKSYVMDNLLDSWVWNGRCSYIWILGYHFVLHNHMSFDMCFLSESAITYGAFKFLWDTTFIFPVTNHMALTLIHFATLIWAVPKNRYWRYDTPWNENHMLVLKFRRTAQELVSSPQCYEPSGAREISSISILCTQSILICFQWFQVENLASQ